MRKEKGIAPRTIAQTLQMKVTRYSDVGTVPTSFHPEAELIYVTKGNIELRVFGKKYIVRENRFVLIMPNVLHEILYGPSVDFWTKSFTEEDCDEFFKSDFSANLICAFFDCEEIDSMKFYSFCLAPQRLLEYRIVESWEKPRVLDNLLYSDYSVALSSVLRRCIDTATAVRYESEGDTYILRVIEYASTHCFEHTSLQKYASYLGIPEHTVRRKIKSVCNEMGYTYRYKDFVYMIRTEHAKRLLRTTNEYICVIARKCGFLNDTRFRRLFFRYAGVKPDIYRKIYHSYDNRSFDFNSLKASE